MITESSPPLIPQFDSCMPSMTGELRVARLFGIWDPSGNPTDSHDHHAGRQWCMDMTRYLIHSMILSCNQLHSSPTCSPSPPTLIKHLMHRLMCKFHAEKCCGIRGHSPCQSRPKPREERLDPSIPVQAADRAANRRFALCGL